MSDVVRRAHRDATVDAAPGVSVIISSRNRPKLLADAVRSVLAGAEAPVEIIVIDQSHRPNEDVRRLASEGASRVRYVWEPGRGVSRGRNEGVRLANGPAVAFIDDDCLVDTAWLGSMARAMRNAGPRVVATGRVVAGSSAPTSSFAPSLMIEDHPASYRGRPARDVLYTGNMACLRAAFEEIGFFDERLGAGTRFGGAEDNDFGFRLLEAGYRIDFVPHAIVTHRAWRRRSEFVRLRWSYGRGQGAFFAKHLSRHDTYMVARLARSIRDHLGRVRWQLRHHPRAALGNVVYVIGVLSGAAEWLLTRGQGW